MLRHARKAYSTNLKGGLPMHRSDQVSPFMPHPMVETPTRRLLPTDARDG